MNNEGGGGRGKRTSTAAPSTPQPSPLHNGTDAPTFLKPDPLPSMTYQEYYEADEILKVFKFTIFGNIITVPIHPMCVVKGD